MTDVYVWYAHTQRAMFRIGDAQNWDQVSSVMFDAALEAYQRDERVLNHWNNQTQRRALAMDCMLEDNGHDPKTWALRDDNSELTKDGYVVSL